jgi:predicted acyl esterase
MRDGVILRADIYRPAGPGPFPTLVYRTPYGKDFATKNSIGRTEQMNDWNTEAEKTAVLNDLQRARAVFAAKQ